MSSSSKLVKDEQAIGRDKKLVQLQRNKQPQWLQAFLERTFFDTCEAHPIRRNELNKYCINCNASACQYCMSSGAHRHHKVLKIYRHVYKDVVSLASMEKYIDCSQIQPYKCNKRLVIALNPLPHSGQMSNSGTSCDICKRRLNEPELYNYCSITCKVMAFSRKTRDLDPPFLFIQTPIKETHKKNALKPVRTSDRKRKGKPCRAPLF